MSAPDGWPPERRALASLLLRRAFRFGDFALSSGGRSPYYFDGRQVSLHGPGARLVGPALLALARADGVSAVGGPAIGADPLVTAIAFSSALDGGALVDAFIVRPQPKAHGAGGAIAGPPLHPGQRVALADDALTTGRSLVEAAARVRETGAEIVAAYVLVDREEGDAAGRLAAAGLPVRALFRRSELLTPAGEPRPELA
ncbi:MAG TPA: orotate phosphoribosyltransferase [Candidatus Dormibacteraeota bacterium]|nr:orotate phosphoribosyltransferase [Candidatus Dormibacteraeota bacterium]